MFQGWRFHPCLVAHDGMAMAEQADVHGDGKDQGASSRRHSSTHPWTAARTREGSQRPCLYPPRACAKATTRQRPRRCGERVGGVRC
jgi:hypothetical protein